MKPQVRVLAFDDGPFSFKDAKAKIAGVVARLPAYIEAVLVGEVEVDGRDATTVLCEMIRNSRYREQVRLIILDGAALGGFNVVDLSLLHRCTGIPVATVTREKPDMNAVRDALQAHFEDWEERWHLLAQSTPVRVSTGHKPIYVDCIGLEIKEAVQVIRQSIVRGALPEPLRIAHLIATAVSTGESRGRA
ncbi:MAG: DUF99 family protein [Candidatus Thermoplasmatota archaeon]